MHHPEEVSLSLDQYAELYQMVRDSGFRAIPAFCQALDTAAIDQNYFVAIERAVHHFAKLCRNDIGLNPFTFLKLYSTPLLSLCDNLSVEGQETMSGRMTDADTIRETILKFSLSILEGDGITECTHDLDTFIIALEHIYNICFDDESDQDESFQPAFGVTLDELCEKAIAMMRFVKRMMDSFSWTESRETTTKLKTIFEQFKFLTDKMAVSNANNELITQARDQLLAIKMKMKVSFHYNQLPVLFNPKKKFGVSHKEYFTQVRVDFYDFDNTLCHPDQNPKISPTLIQKLNIRHKILKLDCFMITARHKEMECGGEIYIKDTGTGVIYKWWDETKTILSTLKEYQLSHLFSKEKIIYCNFYDKVPHPAYTHYFQYSDESKDSKLGDFLTFIDGKIDIEHTAIYDDQWDVWNGIEYYTKNFFHVNNAIRRQHIEFYLNESIVQLILFGKHLNKDDRIEAANAMLHEGHLDQGEYKEYPLFKAALQGFHEKHAAPNDENNIQQAKGPKPPL